MVAHWMRDASAVEPNTGFVALLDIYSRYPTPLRQQKVVWANDRRDLNKGKDERNIDTNSFRIFSLMDLPM